MRRKINCQLKIIILIKYLQNIFKVKTKVLIFNNNSKMKSKLKYYRKNFHTKMELIENYHQVTYLVKFKKNMSC